MSKIGTCIENFCYDVVWYCVKCFTYVKEFFCCCCISKYDPINGEDESQNKKTYDFDYNFLVIEIKVNNKSYTFNNYKEYMNENDVFLTKDFVYDYLLNKKNFRITDEEPDYIITIMDDKTNLITLDKNTCLKLEKSKYIVINSSNI